MALLTASVISVVAFCLLFLSGLRENVSDTARSRQNLGIGLTVIAVLPAWLSYFFANHDHDLHAAVAYCLGVALCVVGLLVAL
jgi:Kef-type K+ transport system membrane component KefB